MPDLSRRSFSTGLAASLSSAALSRAFAPAAHAAAPERRPNFLFICSDQHAWRYTGYAGHPLVKTPNLDRLARRGVNFANAYVGNPVCTPGRACLMTGMFASDTNSFCNSTVWDGSHPTWGSRLRAAGYETWATGKFDLNLDFDMGFTMVAVSNGHCRNPDITSLFRRPVAYRMGEREGVRGAARPTRHKDEKLAQHALDFLANNAPRLDKPFCAYVGFGMPHPAFRAFQQHYDLYPLDKIDLPTIPDGHLEDLHLMFQELRHFKRVATPIPEERVRSARAAYYGMITELDEYVGRLIDQLEKSGQLDNTIIVYTSDHGEMLGEHGLWYKNNLYENAAHVPLLIAGPSIPPNITIDHPVDHTDLVATLLDLAGQTRPPELRGRSLLPMARNQGLGEHRGFAFSESHSEGNCTGSFMIRQGDWKYLHFTHYDDLLFNLRDDPHELTNRIHDKSLRPLRDQLHSHLTSLLDPDEVTQRAFDTQDALLRRITQSTTHDELVARFRGRLGPGLANILAARCRQDLARSSS